MRVFLDTNVIVSALATRGLCSDLVQIVLADHDLLVGETEIAEVRRVLARKMRVPESTAAEVESFLRGQAASVVAASPADLPSIEPADRRVVAEAIAARADVLITGDRELLALRCAELRIVSPRGFWEMLRA